MPRAMGAGARLPAQGPRGAGAQGGEATRRCRPRHPWTPAPRRSAHSRAPREDAGWRQGRCVRAGPRQAPADAGGVGVGHPLKRTDFYSNRRRARASGARWTAGRLNDADPGSVRACARRTWPAPAGGMLPATPSPRPHHQIAPAPRGTTRRGQATRGRPDVPAPRGGARRVGGTPRSPLAPGVASGSGSGGAGQRCRGTGGRRPRSPGMRRGRPRSASDPRDLLFCACSPPRACDDSRTRVERERTVTASRASRRCRPRSSPVA